MKILQKGDFLNEKKLYRKPELKIHGNIKKITKGVPPSGYDDAEGDVS